MRDRNPESVGGEHPDEIRCRSAKKHIERAMKSLAAADRLDAITHLRAALLVIEGHIDVACQLCSNSGIVSAPQRCICTY